MGPGRSESAVQIYRSALGERIRFVQANRVVLNLGGTRKFWRIVLDRLKKKEDGHIR